MSPIGRWLFARDQLRERVFLSDTRRSNHGFTYRKQNRRKPAEVIRNPGFDTEDGKFVGVSGVPVGRSFALAAFSETGQHYYFMGNEANLKEGKTYSLDADKPVFNVLYAEESGLWLAFEGDVTFHKLDVEKREAMISLNFTARAISGEATNINFSGRGRFHG